MDLDSKTIEKIKFAVIIILFIYVVYRLYRIYKYGESFLGREIKTGPEMEYDLSSEITRLYKLQEDNLQKLI
jgi:hypothetical protein